MCSRFQSMSSICATKELRKTNLSDTRSTKHRILRRHCLTKGVETVSKTQNLRYNGLQLH